MPRITKPKVKKPIPPRGIVSRSQHLAEADLTKWNSEFISQGIAWERNRMETLINSPDPTGDDLAYQELNDAFNKAFGLTHGATPSGYTGPINPTRPKDKASWLLCLRENGLRPDDEDSGLILGEL